MQNSPETSRGIRPGVVIAIVAVAAVLIAAMALRRKAPPGEIASAEPPAPVETAHPPAVTPPRPTGPRPLTPAPVAGVGRPTLPAAQTVPAVVTTLPSDTGTSTNWEQRIDGILGDDQTDEPKKADALLALFPTLPEDGQIEAIQHISNLLPDERYPALAPTFTNALTSENVLEVLLTDVLNRPDALKLPTLLDVARIPNHPKATDAIDVLEVYTDENYGTDWAKWEAAVQKYLKENPEQE